jgi:Protein of unknown function (DUF3800)
MSKEIHLYLDDTGSRHPDHIPVTPRHDGMDCFGFGGVLINEEDIDDFIQKFKQFRAKWKIDYPFHSHEIRGGRGNFGWLKKPDNAADFLPALEDFLLSLPFVGIAAIIHRPIYVARYKAFYSDKIWMMSKTAYSVLIERSAKFAKSKGRKLRVFFEGAGKAEDKELIGYGKLLKKEGMPFDAQNSESYGALSAADFQDIVRGDPRRKTKATPMMQIADLVLFPIAKGGYNPSYRPYVKLRDNGKLIDSLLTTEERASLGIKYSCFPSPKEQRPSES